MPRNHSNFVTQVVTQIFPIKKMRAIRIVWILWHALSKCLCNKVEKASECGAAGNALPWGERPQVHGLLLRLKSEVQTNLRLSLLYGLFRAFWCSHRLGNVRYFLFKIGSKLGMSTCSTTFDTKRLHPIMFFDTL